MSTPHAILRAKERYGLVLTRKDLETLAKNIRDGNGLLAGREDEGHESWLIYVQGILVRCVVNKTRERVITFLPRDARPTQKRYSTGIDKAIEKLIIHDVKNARRRKRSKRKAA